MEFYRGDWLKDFQINIWICKSLNSTYRPLQRCSIPIIMITKIEYRLPCHSLRQREPRPRRSAAGSSRGWLGALCFPTAQVLSTADGWRSTGRTSMTRHRGCWMTAWHGGRMSDRQRLHIRPRSDCCFCSAGSKMPQDMGRPSSSLQ